MMDDDCEEIKNVFESRLTSVLLGNVGVALEFRGPDETTEERDVL